MLFPMKALKSTYFPLKCHKINIEVNVKAVTFGDTICKYWTYSCRWMNQKYHIYFAELIFAYDSFKRDFVLADARDLVK